MTLPAWTLFKREIKAALRGRGPYAAVGLAVALGATLAGFAWPDDAILAGVGFRVGFSPYGFLASLAFLLLATVMLAVPALALGSVTAERDRETLPQLRLTLVRPTGAVLALLAAPAGVVVLMLVALAPIFGVVLFTSGIDALNMLGALGVLMLASVTCAALGLACASCARDTATAIGAAYLCVLAYAGLPFLIFAFAATLFGYRHLGGVNLENLLYCTPHGLLYLLTLGLDPFFPQIWPNATRRLPASPVAVVPMLSLLITLASLAVARWGLFRRDLAEPIPKPVRRSRFPWRASLSTAAPWAALRPGWQAVMQAEVRAVRAGRRWPTTLTTASVVLLGLLLNALCIPSSEPGHGPFPWPVCFPILLFLLLVFVLIPRTVAASLPKEWGRGTLALLRASLLTPKEIVIGKAAAGLALLWPVLLGILLVEALTWTLFLLGGHFGSLLQLYLGFGTGVAVVLLATAVSTWAGAVSRHAGYAIASAYAVLIALQVVLPLCAVYLVEPLLDFSKPNSWPNPYYEACAVPSLPAAYLQAALGLGQTHALSSFATASRVLLGLGGSTVIGYTALWAASILFNLLLALAFMAAAVRAFRNRLPDAL